MSADTHEVRDAVDRSRYELLVGGELVGFAEYQVEGQVMTIPHVEVSPALQGRSWGSVLVRETLDDVRARGLRVRPWCPFVRVYIRGHAEYQDLLASEA